jgi:hypothetical protein
MANNQGQQGSDSAWQSNREMNIQGNSSVTNDISSDDDGTEKQEYWRPTDSSNESNASTGTGTQTAQDQSTTGDPGRTPGSAEGVEDFEETGNE